MGHSIVSAPPGENYFTITRTFDAPRALIFKCYTQPEHMAHFWGPRDARTTTRLDLRVGGVWRTDWEYENGKKFGYSSVYLEINPPNRIVYRDAPSDWTFGTEGLPPVQLHSTITLAESEGRTTVTVHVVCPSVAARDENISRGFAGMVDTGHERLAEYLKTLAHEGRM